MARKLQPVTAGMRQPGRPPTRLSSVVDRSEREMLEVLRRKLASLIDAETTKATALSHLLRQFRDVDAEIPAIDARAASVAAEAEEVDGKAPAWDQGAL
jgi:hypothetical protein